ncbi:nucleoside hydrolase [Novosphingobium sp. P6W]|uniref:nucleoside hydrolase n=1 Tax=Novosphingobium sp. P6W TaxID=1609758 RepID=UPI0005C2E727|nr:nucleoside hydrolase [Novosphingobium sp. P6W]AXB79548.1 nucleoside hydrolase [Novosphingobium sp. P6W]KIS34291.1 nucleoside hydrolase [Novosphingobium sp. P6W]
MKKLLTILLAGAALLGSVPEALAAEDDRVMIFFDNDFLGPGQSNIQSMIPLLRDSRVNLIGVGVVTGDAWMTEETQHLLRFLEIAGRPEVPVHKGASMPLLRTQAEMANWEARYGRIPFKGAWNAPRPGRTYHPNEPDLVPPMPEGTPRIKAQANGAVDALIAAVRAHPGKVTIVSAGPLTNIALALRVAPDIAQLAKEIVIEPGKLDTAFARTTSNTDYSTDFNFLFDPEAAHIVLTAPWKSITLVGNVSSKVRATPEVVDAIASAGSPVAKYVKTYARLGQPLWDEVTVAVAIDRSLVTEDLVVRMDVDTMPGMHYGEPQVWTEEMAPKAGERPVHIVRAIDEERFLAGFVAQARK